MALEPTEALMLAYDQERQDERQYWSITTTLLLTAAGALLAFAASAKGADAALWLPVILLSVPVLAFLLLQSATGALRRAYLEALEVALLRDAGHPQLGVHVSEHPSPIAIRALAFNVYSTAFATTRRQKSASRVSAILFRIQSVAPMLLLAAVDAFALIHLWSGWFRYVAAALVAIKWVVVLAAACTMQGTKTKVAVWTLANPVAEDESSQRLTEVR